MQFGNIQGLVNGTETVVFDYEVTGSAASSIATGNILNGDEDGWYTVIVRRISDANSALEMRLNNDSTITNYGLRAIYASNTTVANVAYAGDGYQGFRLAPVFSTEGVGFSVARLYAKSGAVRMLTDISVYDIRTTTVDTLFSQQQVWNNTADNLTNITFSGDCHVGTRVIILKSNNFTNGTPTGVITTPYIKGSWVRVGSQTLGSAQASVTFSSLDGDRDVVYLLSVAGKQSTASDYWNLTINGDSGTTYGRQRMTATNTTVSGGRAAYAKFYIEAETAIASGNYGLSQVLLFADSGFVRPAVSFSTAPISGTTVSATEVQGQVWSNTADNITSLVVAQDGTGKYDTGSRFDLYALRPNG